MSGLETPFCRLARVRLPILNAAIGTASSPALAAAVSNAGGLGLVAASFYKDLEELRRQVRKIRQQTDRPFGINLLLEWPQHERIRVCLEERVPIISLFWGDPAPHVEMIHRGGALVMQTVGSVEEARHAKRCGVDIVVAQGWEAGGHVRGTVASMVLVPRVVDAIHPTPVIAAGGIADGRGIAAVLMLGAAGAMLGTRFICSPESNVPELYREAVKRADETDTVYGETFDKGWPDSAMRTLVNSTMRSWLQAGSPPIGSRPGEHDIVGRMPDGTSIPRYHVTQPIPGFQGDQETLALYAGQSAGLVDATQPAADIVRQLERETLTALERGRALVASPPSRFQTVVEPKHLNSDRRTYELELRDGRRIAFPEDIDRSSLQRLLASLDP